MSSLSYFVVYELLISELLISETATRVSSSMEIGILLMESCTFIASSGLP